MNTFANYLTVNGRKIGPGQPVYVVAEMSANHNQDFEQAIKIVHTAKEAGADAIKLQTYTPDTITINADNEYFKIGSGTLWDGRKLYDLYGEASTPWEWHEKIQEAATEVGLDFFSAPFDDTAVDFLESLGVGLYKIASFELVDLPLIERVAKTGKPMIMSTGMANMVEIQDAVQTVSEAGAFQLALLKCTSAYPSPPEEMNLRTIPHLIEQFGIPIGLSDHTLGTTVPTAAVALGASIVEKHFTLSRSIPGPDSTFSLEPAEFKQMVQAIRITEKALGSIQFGTGEEEKKSQIFRRSLFVVSDLKAGEPFTMENIRSIRPGNGLPPKYLKKILGRHATQDITRGTPLTWDHVTKS